MNEADILNPNHLHDLRSILDHFDAKSSDHQDRAGRLISILLQLHQDHGLSNEFWLEALAMVRRAQKSGVRDAKKRVIPTARFLESAPPSLDCLTDVEDRRAAVEVISTIKAAWCCEYISETLRRPSCDKSQVAGLVNWKRQIAKDKNGFLNDLLDDLGATTAGVELKLTLIKEGARYLKDIVPTKDTCAATNVFRFLEKAWPILSNPDTGERVSQGILTLVEEYLDETRRQCPLVLLQPIFVNAIRQLTAQLKSVPVKNPLEKTLSSLSQATISTLVTLLESRGNSTSDLAKAMLPTWHNAYPTFGKLWRSSNRNGVSLADLIAEEQTAHLETEDDAIASAFARLLPAWHQHLSGDNEIESRNALNEMIRSAALACRIDYLGSPGEVCFYDPISHHLSTDQTVVSTQIRIVRPGVRQIRSDGTFRVVIRALVQST